MENHTKIKTGLEIFKKNKIKVETFAPNHTYDQNTFKALKNSGIFKIIDGYGLMPYTIDGIKFVPQLFYKLLVFPIWYTINSNTYKLLEQ